MSAASQLLTLHYVVCLLTERWTFSGPRSLWRQEGQASVVCRCKGALCLRWPGPPAFPRWHQQLQMPRARRPYGCGRQGPRRDHVALSD